MHESEATILTRGGGECALASDIEWAAQQNLVRLGMTRDWAVDLAAGVDPDSCVAYAILPDLKRIRLVQALPTSLKDALATVASRTYDVCMTKDDATAAVDTVLRASGIAEWEVRSDGPVAGPLEKLDGIIAHVRSGCFIYSGTGLSAEGRRIFYVVGPP